MAELLNRLLGITLVIGIPLAMGIAIRGAAEAFAEKAHPFIKKVTAMDTLLMVISTFIIFGRDFLNAVGTYAIGSQILYCVVVAVVPYKLGLGLPHSQKTVLALGVCTRNIGAALAPLFAAAGTDRRAIAVCAPAVPITVICAFLRPVRSPALVRLVRRPLQGNLDRAGTEVTGP